LDIKRQNKLEHELEQELARIRTRRQIAEATVDEYERRAIRGCRPGQAMHIERRVAELEQETVEPLRRREMELERALTELLEAA
jgi:hypothetical protein